GATFEEAFLEKYRGRLLQQVRIRPYINSKKTQWETYFIADFFDPKSRTFFELKSGNAKLTFNQSFGYPKLANFGGIIESVVDRGQVVKGNSYIVRPRVVNGKRIDPTQVDLTKMSFNQIFEQELI
ncbi:MAG: hypothetical protein AAF399_03080, partial [Bacteroidota bacterium]